MIFFFEAEEITYKADRRFDTDLGTDWKRNWSLGLEEAATFETRKWERGGEKRRQRSSPAPTFSRARMSVVSRYPACTYLLQHLRELMYHLFRIFYHKLTIFRSAHLYGGHDCPLQLFGTHTQKKNTRLHMSTFISD